MNHTPITPREPGSLIAMQSQCGVCGRECYSDMETSLPLHADDDSPLCIMVQGHTPIPFVLPEVPVREFTDAECEEFAREYWASIEDYDDIPIGEYERQFARFSLTKIEAARRTK